MGTIHVPNAAHLGTAAHVMRQAGDWSFSDQSARLVFHERWAYLQPWVIAAIATWGLRARSNGLEVEVQNGHRAGWAWRFGLHKMLDVEPPTQFAEREEAGRFVPLRRIRTASDLSQLLADIVPLLHLADSPGEEKAVQYALSEMTRNVLEHSRSQHGAVVCAQLYPGKSATQRTGKVASRYISIGVADDGIGVRGTLCRNYPELGKDDDAILKAMEFGTTGAETTMYGTHDNAGAGLYFTRRLSQVTGRYFAIASGDAMFKNSQSKAPQADSQLIRAIPPWPGTLVAVEIGLDWPLNFAEFIANTRASFTERTLDTSDRARRLLEFI